MKLLLTSVSNPKSPFGKDNGALVQGFGLFVPVKVYYDRDSIVSHDARYMSEDMLIETRAQKAA
jgi:hypothetical protein